MAQGTGLANLEIPKMHHKNTDINKQLCEMNENHGTMSLYVLHCQMIHVYKYMSLLMGKPTICIGENKGADQLRSNCEADQRLCFRYSDSTIALLLKSEISSF